jgi:hypothetical protein
VRALLWTAGIFTVVSIGFSAGTASVAGTVLATMFGGTAFVLLLAAAFLAVGQSEDRERAREAAERAERAENAPD